MGHLAESLKCGPGQYEVDEFFRFVPFVGSEKEEGARHGLCRDHWFIFQVTQEHVTDRSDLRL